MLSMKKTKKVKNEMRMILRQCCRCVTNNESDSDIVNRCHVYYVGTSIMCVCVCVCVCACEYFQLLTSDLHRLEQDQLDTIIYPQPLERDNQTSLHQHFHLASRSFL